MVYGESNIDDHVLSQEAAHRHVPARGKIDRKERARAVSVAVAIWGGHRASAENLHTNLTQQRPSLSLSPHLSHRTVLSFLRTFDETISPTAQLHEH